MPSKSKAQAHFMAAIAHNPAFAKKVGIPTSVAKDFNKADKGKKFGTGGDVGVTYGGQGQINKQRTRFGSKFGYKLNAPDENLDKYVGKKGGGSVATKKLFGGKETKTEELREAKALRMGAISPKQYVKGEKSEGHKEENVAKQAKDIKSGKLSPAAYAKKETSEPKGMAKGGVSATTKVDPRVHRMLTARAAGAQDPAKARAAAPMFARGGGIETKGKTKGKMIKMCGGGMKGKK